MSKPPEQPGLWLPVWAAISEAADALRVRRQAAAVAAAEDVEAQDAKGH